ncbi:hypothetical protein E1301_Tti022507 [Triplophysa tibetana]|uniref:Ig-like domain-containing protein n=1 Tax=Triplophysa tibetana TaxID=1572043 RepID=A0A5A9NAJ9_9TELE|nr:hypothetical protein E1301_Tti022507 [Triplophysa tibetana]
MILTIQSRQTEALPVVRVTPHTSVFTGETVTLKCEIEDQNRSVNMSFQWSNRRTSVFNSERYTVNTNTLTIIGVTQSDQDQFWCVQGHQSSAAVHVTVKDLPRVTVRVTPDTSVFTGETVTLKCEIEVQYRSLDWRYLWYKDRTEVLSSERYTVNTNTLTISKVTQSDQSQFWCVTEIHGRPQTSQRISAVHLTVIGSKPKAELTSDTEGSVLTGNTVTLTCLMNQFTGWKFYWYKHKQNTEKNTTEGIYYSIHNVTVSDGGQYWCRAGRGNPVYYTNYSDVLWINVADSAASSSSSHGLKVGVAVGLSVMFMIIFLVLLWCYKTRKGKVSESPSGVSPQQNISQTSDQKHNEDGYTPLQSGNAHVYDSVNAADNKNTSTDNVSGAADLTYADIELKPKKEVKKNKVKKNKEKKDVASGSNDVIYAQIK